MQSGRSLLDEASSETDRTQARGNDHLSTLSLRWDMPRPKLPFHRLVAQKSHIAHPNPWTESRSGKKKTGAPQHQYHSGRVGSFYQTLRINKLDRRKRTPNPLTDSRRFISRNECSMSKRDLRKVRATDSGRSLFPLVREKSSPRYYGTMQYVMASSPTYRSV